MTRRTKPRRRAWACTHCQRKNFSANKRCEGCGIGKNTKRTSLKARADAMARELCRLLANGKCAVSGTWSNGQRVPDHPGTDWAHRFPRRHHSIRWSMDNCDFLCRAHHDFFGTHPNAFWSWLSGRGVPVGDIERRANEPWDKDYGRVLSELRAALAERKAA